MENLLNNPFFAWTGIVFWGVVAVAIVVGIITFVYIFAVVFFKEMQGWQGIKIAVAGWKRVFSNEHIMCGNHTKKNLEYKTWWISHAKNTLPNPVRWMVVKNFERQQRERKAAGLNYVQL